MFEWLGWRSVIMNYEAIVYSVAEIRIMSALALFFYKYY